MISTPLTVSIIVECDNLRHADAVRTEALFTALPEEIARAAAAFKLAAVELLLLYDSTTVNSAAAIALHNYRDELGSRGVNTQILARRNSSYYDLKNEGAEASAGELLVFVDSDVIPEPCWLENLCRPLCDDASVSIIGGNTYIAPNSLYSKVFALGWFLPLRSATAPISARRFFFANNVAFRRNVFLAYKYGRSPTFRGCCSALAERLRADGFEIHHQPLARAAHPPPK